MVIAGSILAHYADRQAAPLRATALLIEADAPVCVVSCDVIVVPGEVADRAAGRIADECGVPFDNVLICGTHTHHAPSTIHVHGYDADAEFCRRLEEAIVAAATEARRQLGEAAPGSNAVEAEIGFALSQEATVGHNSRKLLKDGCLTWMAHPDSEIVRPTGPFDPDLPVVAFRRPGGEWAGALFNHSTHNIGACGAGRSPGFYGVAAQELEGELGGRFLFLPGAFGSTHNQVLSDVEAKERIKAAIREGLERLSFGLTGPVRCLKRRLEYAVRHFDEAAEDEAVRAYCERHFQPEVAAPYIEVFRRSREELAPKQGETRQTWLQVVRLGEVALVGVPGEMFGALGLEIRRRSPFRHTFVVGLANDWVGYLPDRAGMKLGGYQCWTGLHSFVAEGTGERMVDHAVEMLTDLWAGVTGGKPASEPALRQLHGEDALRLQRFYNGLCPHSRAMLRPLGWNATLGQCEQVVAEALAAKRHDVVAVSGERLVGWAFLVRMDQDVPHLGIGCADDFLGRGLGKRLMQAVMDKAREEGKKGVDLIVVQANERAWKLYEQYGFRITGAHTGADGQEYYRMRAEF
jgi:RimJ/RimL family protein N-acetyltransferase